MRPMNKCIELKELSKTEKLSTLLTRLVSLANDINNMELKRWATLELNGYSTNNPVYKEGIEIPVYRSVVGEFFDSFGRPLVITKQEFEFINTIKLQQGVSELEVLAEQNKMLTAKPLVLFEMLSRLGINVDEFHFHSSGIVVILSHIRTTLIEKISELKMNFVGDRGILADSAEINEMHPNIIKVSGALYEDGHYRQAVLDAFISVVEYVKIKSGEHELDGVTLMQTIFSPKNPRIKLSENNDQQLGFMWLFSGAVMGIRNYYAHSVVEIHNKREAYELLCLASSLLRILDK